MDLCRLTRRTTQEYADISRRTTQLGGIKTSNKSYEFVGGVIWIGAVILRILGIDPGYATVGFGIIEYDGYNFTPVKFGAATTTPDTKFYLRLKAIFDDIEYLLKHFKPDTMAIEKLFFNTNHKTVIDVSQARGAILVAAANSGVSVHEYTPLQVKQSVVGYGRAEKSQVMEMTRRILGLANVPRPDDAADALAVAICHAHFCKRGDILL